MLGKSLSLAFWGMGLVAAVLAAAAAPAFAQEPKQADRPAQEAQGKRTPEQIQEDVERAGAELREVLQGVDAIVDPAKRKEAAPKAISLMRRMIGGLEEIGRLEPRALPDVMDAKLEFLPMLTLFGDTAAAADLDKLEKESPDKAAAVHGARLTARYWVDPKDEAAQLKVLDEVQKLAKAHPTDDSIAQTLMKMAQIGPASKAVTEKAENIIVADLTGNLAKQVAARVQGQRKLRDAVGKPIELAGTTTDGTAFSTKEWKGKVILVDFWATWCPPCVAELPHIKKAYLNHHAKGLEVLGVSCDRSLEDLKEFAERNKDAPWPQLFDAKENPKMEWNPVAREWGVNVLPTMFLIDRKGVLRSIDARENYADEIPKLLEEK